MVGVAFILSFSMLVSWLLESDSEMITDIIDSFVEGIQDFFGCPCGRKSNILFRNRNRDNCKIFDSFVLFDCEEVIDCVTCFCDNRMYHTPVDDCQEGTKLILRQMLAWFIHILCCALFIIFVGFCSSLSFFMHATYNEYPNRLYYFHTKLGYVLWPQGLL